MQAEAAAAGKQVVVDRARSTTMKSWARVWWCLVYGRRNISSSINPPRVLHAKGPLKSTHALMYMCSVASIVPTQLMTLLPLDPRRLVEALLHQAPVGDSNIEQPTLLFVRSWAWIRRSASKSQPQRFGMLLGTLRTKYTQHCITWRQKKKCPGRLVSIFIIKTSSPRRCRAYMYL
jgi:hypothetical protein